MMRNVPGFGTVAKQHAVVVFPKMGIVAVAPFWNVVEVFVPDVRESEFEIEEKFFSSLVFNPAACCAAGGSRPE